MEGLEAVREKMADGLMFVLHEGYIVIMQGAHVGGYIVNNEYDTEFEYGDFLLADYDMSPLRTVARGNVVRGDLDHIGPYGVR